MTNILVVYYSAYGHIANMAEAVAEGVRQAGGNPTLARIIETESGITTITSENEVVPVATLPNFDGFVFGTPTRFGNMAAPMKHFIDGLSGLWAENALVGKVGGVFTSSDSQHGGQEHTLLSMNASLMHLGLLVAGLPYSFTGQTRMDEITGGSPYGATTLARGIDGVDRRPTMNELEGARFQGRHLTGIATAIHTPMRMAS